MSYRVTEGIKFSQGLADLQRIQSELFKIQTQITTGTKVNNPSDDPVAFRKINNLSAQINQKNQYSDNIQDGMGWLNNNSVILQEVENILTELIDLSTETAQGIITSAERVNVAAQVDNLLRELVDTANSKYLGKYIFGGDNYLTEAFSINLSGGVISSVSQNSAGIDGTFTRMIDEGIEVVINLSGSAVFQPNGSGGSGDIFQTVIRLREALSANDGNTISEIKSALKEIEQAFDQVLDQDFVNASRTLKFDMKDSQLEFLKLNDLDTRSALQDTDLAEAYLELTKYQTSLQASLQTISQFSRLSLFNYL